MTTRELIQAEIANIPEEKLPELYDLIQRFTISKASSSGNIMAKLREIRIEAPTDFAVNSNSYPKEQAMKPDPSHPPEPFPREKIPPEILEWARQTFDEEEFLAHVRQIEATGGLRLEDFLAELEARVRGR